MMRCERIAIENTNIITPYRILEHGTLLVENGKIAAVCKKSGITFPGATVWDAGGKYSSPGFIDLHTHGAGGSDFMDGDQEAFLAGARTHLAHGTTLLLPTTVAGSREGILQTIAAFEAAKGDEVYGSMLHGLHLEGPYFSPTQRGAQDPVYIRNPDEEEYREIISGTDCIARWSSAPELPGSAAFGRCLRENGILPSIGHSDAVYEDVAEAFENGYTLATHLFSGMSTVKRVHAYRHPGVIESALCLDEMDVELICDGSHLPAELVRMVWQIKGPSRTALITDSIRAAGTDEKESIIGGRENGLKVLVEDGVAKLPDRSAFAGSVATADVLLRFAWKTAGLPLTDVVRMMTSTPARILGVEKQKGRLAPGMDADVVIFNENAEIGRVMRNGRWMTGGTR